MEIFYISVCARYLLQDLCNQPASGEQLQSSLLCPGVDKLMDLIKLSFSQFPSWIQWVSKNLDP